MIGPKKLSVIRRELHDALSTSADDPIRWLEERLATPPRRESPGSGEGEVLQSLRRILEAEEVPPRQTKKVRSNK
jgi:hypothetical protein